MLTLYGENLWDSPFVFTALVALEEKRLDYQVRTFRLNQGEHRKEPFHSQSVTGRVPALEHDGFVLAESVAIVEYLEEVFPAPEHPRLLPADRRERARARQVLGWLRSDLTNLRRDRPTESMFFSHTSEALSESGQKDVERLFRIAQLLLDDGARTTLFSEWCIADADLAFMLGRLRLNGDSMPPFLERYVDASFERPSAQVFLDKPRPASAAG
jgi:glutathione S-transferase